MRRPDTPMEVALKGAVAGAVGTLVLTVAMSALQQLAGRASASSFKDDEFANAMTPAPARFVGKIASGVFERELPTTVQNALGEGVHWGYGMLWGVIYAIVQSSIRLPHVLHGSIFGLIVWLVGPLGLIPAMRLTPSPEAADGRRPLRSMLLHQVFGWSVALIFAGLAQD